MFLYTNKFGQNVMCHGVQDMQKADGVNIDLRQMVVHYEEGQLIGIQGGSLSLQKSMPLIKAMRDEQLLMKAKPVAMRKSVAPSRSIAQSRELHKSLSDNIDKFSQLHRDLAAIKRMQNA